MKRLPEGINIMKIPFYFISINLVLVALILRPKYLKYRSSEYAKNSGNSFFKTLSNKGNYGEFLTFLYLEEIDIFKILLTNVYLPASANINMYQ